MDTEVYAAKIDNINILLKMLDELGVQIAGSNIVGADFRMLAVSVENVNKVLSGLNTWPELKAPILDNVVDFKKVVEQLQAMEKSGTLSSELAPIIQGQLKDGVVKGANGLGDLLGKAIDMQPELAKQYGVQKQGNGFSIDGMPAHVAVADNRAALIVLDFLKQFAQSAQLISQGTSLLGPAYGNGVAGPYSNKTRETNPSAFGGGTATTAERAAAADVLVQETNAQEENNRAVKTGTDLAQKRLADDKEYKKLLDQLTDARRAYQIVDNAIGSDGVIKPEDKVVLEGYLVKLDELAKTSQEAATAAASLRAAIASPSKGAAFRARRDVKAVGEDTSLQMSQKAYEAEAAVKEVADKRKAQSARNYENTATQVERNITGASNEATKAQKANTATRVVSIEQEEKARKDASDTIKRIYKDQVEAEKAVQAATKESINQWVTGRYALYDVGNAYQNVSTQLFRVARRIFDITKSYRDYETAFTSVERAMQLDFSSPASGAQELKDQFIKLSEVIPVAFEELSRVATLGAQMGIGAKGIVKFTETVSQFAAVTGISADTVAQKFGKIAELTNLDTSDFDRLGSAVAFAGINAVATESEILTLSEGIAAVSSQVGMTTPDVIGLGTALSSVGVPAEQARGVFTRVFADIDRAVSSGGEAIKSLGNTSNMTKKEINKAFKDKNALTGFAAAANMSVEEFSNAWGKQGKSYDVFRAILGGINSAADLTKAFDKLGITETREVNTLTRLAKNLNVVDQAASDSAASFGDGQFLLESFSKTTDNLDSKITIFQNNLKSLGEQLGQNFSGTLKEVVDIGSEISKIFKEISKSPVMQMLTNVSLGTTVLVGGLTGFMSVMAKVVAQIYAFRVAMVNSANDPAAVSGITKQIKQLTNFRSGLIEMRNELQTPNAGVRGNIQPVDYGVFGSIDKQIQKKLESDNLYIASGDKVLQSIDARKRAELQVVGVSSIREAKDAQRVLLARTEADQINKLVIERRNEIKNLEQLVDTSTAAGRAKIAEATASKILYRWVKGEAIAYTEAEVARARGIVSGEILANKKQKEAAAHLLNADAINAETAAASRASTGIMGVGSKVMGFLGGVGIAATVLTTIIGIIDGIRVAVGEANKIDLAGSGFTVEALKDTITQDTQAWMDNGEAIGLVTASYTSTQVGVNKYADAVSIASSKSKQLYTDQKSLVDVTKQQTVALGDATRSLLSNAILANEKIKQIIDSNGEIFQQLAKSGVDVAEFVDSILQGGTKPQEFFKKIADEIAAIDQEIANVNSNLNSGDGSGVIDTNTSDYLTNLEQRKAALVALGDAGREAIAQIEKALVMSKVIDMLKGYSAGFVGLEAKIKAAAKSGKGMAGVLALVKTAAADLIKNTDIVVNFDGDKSVAEMLKTAKAAKETALALLRLKLAASNASPTAAGQAEQSIIAQYAPLLKNLELLSNSVDSVTDAAAKGAESAADKLKRLISEANSLASASMQLNSALRSVGDAFKASKDWSISSEGGAAKFDAILAVITQIGENAGSNFPKAIRELQAFQITLKTLNAPAAAINLVSNAIKKLGGDSTLTAKQIAALKKAFPTLFANMLEQVKNGTTEIKTLIDYANDLKSVMSDALSRRYGKQTSLDEISNAWQAIKDSAKSAQQAMDDANKTIVGLNADKNLLDYQLKIAIKYKDIERQKYLTNKLAEVNANLAEESQKVSEANALKDKSLKGDSKNVIDNRNQVRGLVQTYTNYLATLAASGMSSTDLKAKAGVLAEEFLTQGQNLGFAKNELKEYTDAFLGDFTKVIDGVPNEVTLKVNTDPALAAIEEFVKKANKSLSNVNIVGGTNTTNTTTVDKPTADEILAYKAEKVNSTLFALASWDRAAAADKVKAFEAKYGKGYATGGFISGPGTGTSDSIPALL
jgi:TP901 family phage tail tape measure protein